MSVLIVLDIDVIESSNGAIELALSNAISNRKCVLEDRVIDSKVLTERIQGYKFHNGDKTICIGWSKKVQELLGLPFHSFDALHAQVKSARKTNMVLSNKLSKAEVKYMQAARELRLLKKQIHSMKFINRLIYLFSGVFPWKPVKEEREVQRY